MKNLVHIAVYTNIEHFYDKLKLKHTMLPIHFSRCCSISVDKTLKEAIMQYFEIIGQAVIKNTKNDDVTRSSNLSYQKEPTMSAKDGVCTRCLD